MLLSGDVNQHMLATALAGGPEFALCTPGGDPDIARALADYMSQGGRSITAIGNVASSGVPIFAAARRRLSLSSTVFLWHSPYASDVSGRAGDLTVLADGLVAWYDWACTLLGETTNRSADFWHKLGMEAGAEFTAYDALEYGLCDSLVAEPSHTLLQAIKAAYHVTGGQQDGSDDHSDLGQKLTRHRRPPGRYATRRTRLR